MDILQYIESKDLGLFKKLKYAVKAPKLGRWDVLLCAQTPEGFRFVAEL